MKMRNWAIGGLLLVFVAVSQQSFADPHRLGLGVRYNAAAKTLGDGFDSSGLSYLLSYQLVPASIFKLEADAEIIPSSLTGNKMAVVPQVYALLGSTLYAGLGIGIAYTDGEFSNDPIYNIRAGLDLPLGAIHIVINANYRFSEFDELSHPSSDNIQVALLGRYEF